MNAVALPVVTAEALSRREFLRRLQAMGGLLLIADGLHIAKAADAPKYGAEGMEHGTIDNPLVFVAVGDDGWVTILAHRSEMGQGVRTGMPLIVADEMEADWSKVRVLQAPADEVRYGNQDTDGSRSTRHFIDPMRRCGAAARTMLEQAAALAWSVPVAEVHAINHEVLHDKTGRKLSYGALAKRAAKLPVPQAGTLRLKKAEEFRYVGKGGVPLVDGHDIVTGQAQYGIDPWFKDMSFAVIARSPVLGGTVKQFDGKAASAAPGVLKVLQMPGPVAKATFHPLAGVAVIANSTGAAIAARKLLKIDWDDGANGSYDSDAYRASMQESAHKPGQVVRESGNVDTALKAAAKTIEAEYYIPHIAHATMEPPCAVARIVAGKCEVWAPTQAPQATREDVAKHLGISEDNVTVHVTLLGGGFGRKSKPDFATEAALLSQALDGRPVKVTWTREDDLHHDYLHTVSVEYLKAGVDANGKVSGWLHRSVAPSLVTLFNPKADHESGGELGMGFINMPYDIPNLRMENPAAAAHCRIGWFRSVDIPHAFAVQSFVSELAASANRDHRDYLLDLIGPACKIDPASLKDGWNHGESPQRYPVDTGRLRRVVETVTQEAGWGRKFARGQALGLAAHYSFVSYAAAVVEVDIDELGRIRIPRVDVAFDCGPQVNPERIRSQLEGAVIMGLSLAMFGEITFKNGRAQQDNFHQYRVMRMNEAPSDIRVHLIPFSDWTMPLGGVGEPGIPPIAPALCNAVFAATGKRIRRCPLKIKPDAQLERHSGKKTLAGLAPPPLKPALFLKTIRASKGNPFEIMPLAAFEQPVYLATSPLGKVLIVNDLDAIRRILLDNVANYPKHALGDEFFSAMFGEGLLSAPHLKWRTHRKVMAPSFGTRTVESYAPAMVETALAFAQQWDALPDSAEIDIAEEMKALTLKIICRTMFSSDAEELAACSRGALDFAQASMEFGLLDVLPLIGPRRIKRKQEAIRAHFQGMDTAIYRLISEREKSGDEAPKDLLTRLVAAKDPDDGAGLNATEVRDEVITIFMAGHETTAVTMTWVWYLLSQHPAEEAKLHVELDGVLGGRPPTVEDLPQLPYTRMVIEEAMRVYPPAPGISIREAKVADEICGFKVEPGLQIMIAPWILHRHRSFWDEPERFDPARFSKESNEKRPRFAYLPFGGGPRVCIGATLAMTEAILILAVLAQRFQLRLKEGQDIQLQTRITLRPKNKMMTILERRATS